tara:strand:- start:2113 stop:2616 length:504 start_codon:yes stop_codon:yes gene_type:complete
MSNIRDVQEKIQKQLDEINIEALNDKLKLIGYFHDRMVPILNEVMTSSASEAKDYEDAYKIVTTKLRNIIASITAEKRNSEAALMTSVGKRDALEDILKDVSEIAQKTKEEARQEKIENIAQKIQSGSFDPDVPRKIGQRPEKIKDIRAAKATLFGGSTRNQSSEEQ